MTRVFDFVAQDIAGSNHQSPALVDGENRVQLNQLVEQWLSDSGTENPGEVGNRIFCSL